MRLRWKLTFTFLLIAVLKIKGESDDFEIEEQEEEEEVAQVNNADVLLAAGVETLSSTDYIKNVLKSNQLSAVFYYINAPACAYCPQAAVEFASAAPQLQKLGIQTHALDLGEDASISKATGYLGNVPAIKFYVGESTRNPYGGPPLRTSHDVAGSLGRKIQQQITKLIPQHVTRVEFDEDLVTKVGEAESVALVIFTDRAKTSGLAQSIAYSLHLHNVPLIEATAAGTGASMERYGVSSTPGVVLLRKDGSRAGVYAGDLKDISSVVEFAVGSQTPGDALEDEGTSLSADHVSKIMRGEGNEAWVLAFISQEDKLEDEIPGWSSATKDLVRGSPIQAGVVDCAVNGDICEGEDYPVVIVRPHIDELEEEGMERILERYPPPLLSKAIKSAESSLPENIILLPLKGLDAMNQRSIVETALSSGGNLTKSLYVVVASKKKEPSTLIKLIAAHFGKRIVVIYLYEPNLELVSQLFAMPKIPGLSLIHATPTEMPEEGQEGQVGLRAMAYDTRQMGPLNYRNLASVVEGTAQQLEYIHKQREEGHTEESSQASDFSAPTDVTGVELTAENFGTDVCNPTKGKLCIILFLDRSSDVDTAVKVATDAVTAESGGGIWEVVWVDAMCQPEFVTAFGVDVYVDTLPAMAVYAAKRQRLSRFSGKYDVESVRSFLASILSSKASSTLLPSPPGPVNRDCEEFAKSIAAQLEQEPETDLDMEDLLAEIRADEAREKKLRKEQLKQEAEEAKRAALEAEAAAAKPKPKKKKKKAKKKVTDTEL